MRDLAESHPALLAMGLLLLIATVVLGLVTVMMQRRGLSPRPVIWFAVFFALIVGPQAAWHGAVAAGWVADLPTWTPAGDLPRDDTPLAATVVEADLAHDGTSFRTPERVFGPDVDRHLVRDSRLLLGRFLDAAEIAQHASYVTGETMLVARLATPDAARQARDVWLMTMGIPRIRVDVATRTRPVGDRARVAVAGRTLFAWTAADDATLDRRLASISAVRIGPAAPAPGAPAPPPLRWILAGAGLNVLLVVLWFFKGLTWATEARPTTAAPQPAAALSQRLLALGRADVPFGVTPGPGDGEVQATWCWADARWIDLARARGVRRTHRFVLALDEAAHVVRVREYWSAWDWSAGRGGAHAAWHAARGVTFFRVERERVLGAQLDERGLPTGALSKAWTFDLDEMRLPLQRAVVESGWIWRPVAWQGPGWLRWLTG
ncbi:MAG: hypothetical protein KIT14_16015 [bacterium]|nr:hypothetical protein [bacterium]